MRLIDADKIQLNLWVPSRNNEIVKAFENSVIDALDRQPTVEAIPLEWMKKWHEEEDRRLGDGWTHIEHPHSHSRMIADWRAECEKQQNTTSV